MRHEARYKADLSYYRVFERSLIRQRSIAGQISAFRRGVKLGRRKQATPVDVVQQMQYPHATGNFT